jgi:hypothetical protein
MPDLQEYLREDGRLPVKVDKAMYGLIQSTKLWYKELTRQLCKHEFKKYASNEFVF